MWQETVWHEKIGLWHCNNWLMIGKFNQQYTQTQIKVKEQLVVRKDIDVNEYVKLSSSTDRHKLKLISVLLLSCKRQLNC
jgi:hypothetical protein